MEINQVRSGQAKNGRTTCTAVAEIKTRLVDGIEVHRGSANVFFDHGLPDPDELKMKRVW
ncbi:hypothetical protein [Actimicrobium antarcticum]|uniref:hypothetical protein n=1 Tax=Actimicrobium antarcticum TaxID=1051899 RepID=UPI0031D23B0B